MKELSWDDKRVIEALKKYPNKQCKWFMEKFYITFEKLMYYVEISNIIEEEA